MRYLIQYPLKNQLLSYEHVTAIAVKEIRKGYNA